MKLAIFGYANIFPNVMMKIGFASIEIVISLCFSINGIAMKTKFTLTNPNLHSPQLYFQTIAIIWLNRLSGYFSGWMGGCRLLELILSSASARLN